MERPKIFISYSHKDAEWRDRLVTHLDVLKQQGLLDYWTDVEIGIGDTWFQKIQEGMNAATVAIMLISANFLTSTFIRREEIERLLKRRAEENLPIFPILVRPCAWDEVPWLAELQIRPQDTERTVKALASYNDPHGAQVDEHLTAIVREIKAKLVGPAEPPIPPPPVPPVKPPEPAIPSLRPLLSGITNSIGMKLVLIPAGEFLMGAEDGGDDEKPVHRVQISKPFYLGKFPVTQEQWQKVMGHNPSKFKGDLNTSGKGILERCSRISAQAECPRRREVISLADRSGVGIRLSRWISGCVLLWR